MLSGEERSKAIKREMLKAQILKKSLEDNARWYERAAVISVLLISSVLPLKTSLKLCWLTTRLMAANPRNRIAVDTVSRINTLPGAEDAGRDD